MSAIRVSCFFSLFMEVKRRADWTRAWRMVATRGQWTPRRQNDWTLKIVVACCVALFFLSPGFSRMLPNDSTTYLGRSAMLERRSVMAHEMARSEMRERILRAVVHSEVETGAGREGADDDLTSDYSTPTHNHNGEDEIPSPPASKASTRSRASQQFSRYTAQYGHRHLRGV